MANRVGEILTVRTMNLRSMPAMRGQPRQGSVTFQLTGTKGKDILVVKWEQPNGETAPKVVRIEDGRGQSIEP